MKKSAVLVLGLALRFAPGVLPAAPSQTQEPAPVREKDLDKKYQDWLKLAAYVILPVERDVFFKLQTGRDRDIFIESFWKQRDPTPATPQNEFKDEHVRRFNYANQFYRRGTPREGWMTDMGRIYIILGAPQSIERFEGTAGIRPCQVWYYYGDTTKRQPTYFGLVFCQRGGGEFRLYNPTSDGPASLIVDTVGLDVTNSEAVYEKIKSLAPTLAAISISLVPGQYSFNYEPTPQNNIILADILDTPKKNISVSYATHFLNYKGIVNTEYMTNFIESSARLAVTEEPVLGVTFLHFAVTPKRVSVDFYEPKNQYFCNFKLDVSLRKGAATVLQYSKEFPFYFPPDNVAAIKANGLSVQDSFPIIEGTYRLTVLLQNAVGKEFSIYENEVVVPAAPSTPRLLAPIVGYKILTAPGSVHAPFQAMDRQILVDPNDTLGGRDQVAFMVSVAGVSPDVWKSGGLEVAVRSLGNRDSVLKSETIPLASLPFSRTLPLAGSLPVSGLSPDYYEIALSLKAGDGRVLDTKTSNFVLSREESVPHPVTLAKSFPLANAFLYYGSLAYQADKAGDPAGAEGFFEKVLALRPEYLEGAADYGHFLIRQKKFDRALDIAGRLKDGAKLGFDYHLIRGQALAGLEKYQAAIDDLLASNKIYNSDTRVLNALGISFYRTRRKTESVEALKASLRLDPDQADIKALLAKAEKELR